MVWKLTNIFTVNSVVQRKTVIICLQMNTIYTFTVFLSVYYIIKFSCGPQQKYLNSVPLDFSEIRWICRLYSSAWKRKSFSHHSLFLWWESEIWTKWHHLSTHSTLVSGPVLGSSFWVYVNMCLRIIYAGLIT